MSSPPPRHGTRPSPHPTDGMHGWLTAEKRLEVRVAGAWVTPEALGVVARATMTATATTDGTTTEQRLVGTRTWWWTCCPAARYRVFCKGAGGGRWPRRRAGS